MNKLIAIILVVVLAFGGAVTYFNLGSKAIPSAPADEIEVQPAEPVAQPADDTTEQPADDTAEQPVDAAVSAEPVSTALDFDAIYALHEPDEVVMELNGTQITWGEYFYCLFSQASQLRSSMEQIKQYYGMESTWSDPIDEEGSTTISDLAVENSLEMLKQQKAIAALADENSIALTDEDKALLEEEANGYVAQFCGEDGTEEAFAEFLKGIYISREQFDEINRLNVLYDRIRLELYGENGEKVSDADAVKYLEDNDYLSCTHILFMTIDPSTREALDEAVVAEKKAKAEEIAAQLQAIEDKEELKAAFTQLKNELCEDTGKTLYPDGYLFTPGTMVAEFEDTTKALEDLQVSDPVESSYGYHVIMRLPLDPDMAIDTTGSTASTARSIVAKTRLSESIQSLMDNSSLEMLNGYTAPNLADFVK